jgi:hypothetical protein
MKSPLKTLCCIGLLVSLAAFAQAAEKTWTGKISGSMCGASHAKMIAEHPGTKTTDRDCTLACIRGGAKYVFVSGGKIYNIENQELALLREHAGDRVRLTGEMKGDTITVSNIVTPGKKAP